MTTSTKIRVADDVTYHEDDDGDKSGREYSRRNTAHQSHNIEGIHILDGEAGYRDLTVPFEVKPGEVYYLVYALYKSGDSFGNSYGNIEFVDLFTDMDTAWECYRAVEASRLDTPYQITLTNQNGKEYLFGCPWYGYFEDLESVKVVPVIAMPEEYEF